jgi:hypothetical protein
MVHASHLPPRKSIWEKYASDEILLSNLSSGTRWSIFEAPSPGELKIYHPVQGKQDTVY